MDATDYDAVYACNCAKDDRKRVAVRRYAGVFVTVLPCGLIVTVHHLFGSESLPQVALCFAEALSIFPRKTFICYDNACALARFCRNPVRADLTEGARALRDCVFFLPDSHIRGHTACLDATSTYYLPEVRKASHDILRGVNSEAQEHVFAWVRWLIHVANPMAPTRHRLFFLLLSIARNARQHTPAPRARPARSWRLWSGSRRREVAPEIALLPTPPSPRHAEAQPSEASPPHADAQPAEVRPRVAEAYRFLKNLRDNKLHRVSVPGSVSCGAMMPKRFSYHYSREEVGRHKLCLRPGCFSPGSIFRGDHRL